MTLAAGGPRLTTSDPGARAPLPTTPGSRGRPGRSGLGRLAALLDDPSGPAPTAAASDRVGGGGAPRRRLTGAVRAHPLIADAAIALFLAAISAPRLIFEDRPGVGQVVLQVALLVPLIWRRRYPVGVFVTLSLIALAQFLANDRLLADAALLVALCTLSVHRPRRTALAAATILEIGVVMATVRWTLTGSWVRSLVFLSGMVAAAFLLGINVRTRRAHMATLIERAERLEHERDQQARMAAVAERTRIAREMHDVLAHSLAVMVSLADGAAAKLVSEPERAATAIAHVSDLGRQSLRDTRRLLGVLRADDTPGSRAGPDVSPQPDVSQLDDLVARVRATGLDASLEVTGDPFDIPPGAGLTVYRIVQEALTNSVKHAAGAHRVQVRLRYDAPELDIEVDDDGLLPWPADGGAPAPILGHGLAGMRERASVHQGIVAAGPGPDGGWRVQARLPVGPGGPR
ncbi:MAG: histidine kinase [Actinomycetota bacterium]|nr:histidine kinase [Actinomycetota bacterium]